MPTARKGGRTWHAAFCLSTLHPLATLVPPMVLVYQDHIHKHPVMACGLQSSHSEREEWEHSPAKNREAAGSIRAVVSHLCARRVLQLASTCSQEPLASVPQAGL